MKRLNGMDAMLLYSETPNLHTHTLKVAVINPSGGDAEFDFEVFRRHLRRRLHLLEPLRYKLVDIPWRLHHPMWLENCDVDLNYHLRRIQVPAPGGRRELDTAIGTVASTPLDRTRPLWEFHFAEGLAGASPEHLADIEISPAGLGLHWPRLDADLYVPALLQGMFGSKSWMARELGAEGGRARTVAKIAASRANGRKGGRPKKAATA